MSRQQREHDLLFSRTELVELNAVMAEGTEPSLDGEVAPVRPRQSVFDNMVEAAFEAEGAGGPLPRLPRPPPLPAQAPQQGEARAHTRDTGPIASVPPRQTRRSILPQRRPVLSGEINLPTEMRTTQPDLPAMASEDSPFSSVEGSQSEDPAERAREVAALARAIGLHPGAGAVEDIMSSTPAPMGGARVAVASTAGGSVKSSHAAALEALSRAVLEPESRGDASAHDPPTDGAPGPSSRTPIMALDESDVHVVEESEEVLPAPSLAAPTPAPVQVKYETPSGTLILPDEDEAVVEDVPAVGEFEEMLVSGAPHPGGTPTQPDLNGYVPEIVEGAIGPAAPPAPAESRDGRPAASTASRPAWGLAAQPAAQKAAPGPDAAEGSTADMLPDVEIQIVGSYDADLEELKALAAEKQPAPEHHASEGPSQGEPSTGDGQAPAPPALAEPPHDASAGDRGGQAMAPPVARRRTPPLGVPVPQSAQNLPAGADSAPAGPPAPPPAPALKEAPPDRSADAPRERPQRDAGTARPPTHDTNNPGVALPRTVESRHPPRLESTEPIRTGKDARVVRVRKPEVEERPAAPAPPREGKEPSRRPPPPPTAPSAGAQAAGPPPPAGPAAAQPGAAVRPASLPPPLPSAMGGAPCAAVTHTPPPIPQGAAPPPPPIPAAGSAARPPALPAERPQQPPPSILAALPPTPAAEDKGRKRRRGKQWFEEIFDEDYLRTLPYLTPRQTEAEVNFLLETLELAPGSRVLDVGCGYGRHAMELASRGHRPVGIDLSLPLLIRAADAARRVGVTVDFVHGDMREMAFESEFDAAYCYFTTFGYFDDETNRKVAAGISRALRPGGRFLLDLINRDYIIGDLPTRVWWQGEGCVILEEVDFNYFTSRLQVQRQIILEDGRQLEQEISIRTYSLHEIGKVLHHAGFRVLEVSGGAAMRGRFFGKDSRQLLVLAEKRSE